LNESDKALFEYLMPKKTYVRVVQRHPKNLPKPSERIFESIEKELDVKITDYYGIKTIRSITLSRYLKTFFEYKNQWSN